MTEASLLNVFKSAVGSNIDGFSTVRVSEEGELAHVTLSRPEKHNGIDFRMLKELIAVAESLRHKRGIRAVILRGEGPSFCAGLDFKSVLADPVQAALGFARLWSPTTNVFQRMSLAWRDIPVPVLAVVHGSCFGGGLQLALGADFRFATPDAKLSVMEAKWGLIPDMGGTVTLRELVPIDVAKELAMTGRIVSGIEAKALGLVTHISDDPLEDAKKLAAEIATRSPDSVAAAKSLLHRAWSGAQDVALSWERRFQRRLLGSKNQRIALKASLEKQTIAFSPRKWRG
ncbi:crotonase/enoyl-CoA hydratase family protein [Pendulispora albinea]|uniref:Crotonase/enoyl-CoA hydratase family protein n=1 Tax=Pendulispora albinea TaxID=2741071 RepID=A0ABZ2M7Z4_9BACT